MGTDPGNTLQEAVFVLPRRAFLDPLIDVAVETFQLLVDDLQNGLDAFANGLRMGLGQAIAFRPCASAPAGDGGPVFPAIRPFFHPASARIGGRIASAKRANPIASRRSVLAKRPVALAKSRAWRGLITTTGNPARQQFRHRTTFIATGGFQHRSIHGSFLAGESQFSPACGRVGDLRSRFLLASHKRNVQGILGNINSSKPRIVRHVRPILANTGLQSPSDCSGSTPCRQTGI